MASPYAQGTPTASIGYDSATMPAVSYHAVYVRARIIRVCISSDQITNQSIIPLCLLLYPLYLVYWYEYRFFHFSITQRRSTN